MYGRLRIFTLPKPSTMKFLNKAPLLLLLLIIPTIGVAQVIGSMATTSTILFIFNTIVWITSAISIKQLVWHGEYNRSPFHVFNIILVIAYHSISLSFLIHHKDYFEGYQALDAMGCVRKYFLSTDLTSLLKRIIEIGFICNIIYLIRYGKEYYINSN